MRVLVTGAKGQLGFDVCSRLQEQGIAHLGIDIAECDLTVADQVRAVFSEYAPDAVIHCAAFTAVDKAETEVVICRRVNVDGTRNVAEACKSLNAAMMYISTDYVFSGQGSEPFETDEPYNPQNVYGISKVDGEKVVRSLLSKYFIVRISWAFGANGQNFVKTMRRLGKEKAVLSVVSDQVGSPTYTQDLSFLLIDMICTDKYGIYHATNEGYCTWAEFAQQIMTLSGLNCRIQDVLTKDYPTAAKRPLNSRMSKNSLDLAGFKRLRSWQEALRDYISVLENENK